jgi:hypothetical protein
MNLEHELKQALARKNPPRGFEERVLRKIAAGETVESPVPASPWARRALALAASLVIVFGGGYYLSQHKRQEQVQTERAARDVVLALQIASEKVSAVQVKVQEITHERHN